MAIITRVTRARGYSDDEKLQKISCCTSQRPAKNFREKYRYCFRPKRTINHGEIKVTAEWMRNQLVAILSVRYDLRYKILDIYIYIRCKTFIINLIRRTKYMRYCWIKYWYILLFALVVQTSDSNNVTSTFVFLCKTITPWTCLIFIIINFARRSHKWQRVRQRFSSFGNQRSRCDIIGGCSLSNHRDTRTQIEFKRTFEKP